MNQEKIRKAIAFLWDTAQVVAIALAIILPIRYFLATPFLVKGASMEPNFENWDYLVVDEISYRFHEPHRGDVIVLEDPVKNETHFIKRVVGLPHERVEIRDGEVLITDASGNPQILQEPYLNPSIITRSPERVWDLQEDEYFVMGDNRHVSFDSRYFGPITKGGITGRSWIHIPLGTWVKPLIDFFKKNI